MAAFYLWQTDLGEASAVGMCRSARARARPLADVAAATDDSVPRAALLITFHGPLGSDAESLLQELAKAISEQTEVALEARPPALASHYTQANGPQNEVAMSSGWAHFACSIQLASTDEAKNSV